MTISFYSVAATYDRDVGPIAAHRVTGRVQENGTVLLGRRVIAARQDEPGGRDLVVRIDVDGAERCFCKAKYLEAQQAGVQRDRFGAFFIDAVPAGVYEMASSAVAEDEQSRS